MKRAFVFAPAAIAALCAMPIWAAGSGSDARSLYTAKCAMCHGASLSGGRAPALNKEGRKRSLSWITAEIQNPKVHNSASRMPSAALLKLTGPQISTLAAFLYHQK